MKKFIRLLRRILYASDLEKEDQRSLIVFFLVFSLVLSLIQTQFIIGLIYQLILYSFSGIVALSLFLAYRNILLPGRVIAPLAGFAVITIFVYGNGIHDEAIGGYYLVLMIAGLLLADRGWILFGILNTVAIIGIGLAEYNGWISTRLGYLINPSTIFTSAFFMLGTTLALHFMILRLNRETENARKSEQAQLAANEDLRKLQAELEDRVNHRTAELQAANGKMKQQLGQIENLQDKLQQEAIRDPLTGLFNRRYLEETLVREIARARRENYDISFMLLDIDHFKQFNDRHGHAAGDLVLKALAERLSFRVRLADIPCRLGGEEFLLVLPGILDEVAQLRAEYFRDQVQTMPVPYGEENLTVTVSIGIASYPKNGDSWAEIYPVVDRALYRAKDRGRNRVETA